MLPPPCPSPWHIYVATCLGHVPTGASLETRRTQPLTPRHGVQRRREAVQVELRVAGIANQQVVRVMLSQTVLRQYASVTPGDILRRRQTLRSTCPTATEDTHGHRRIVHAIHAPQTLVLVAVCIAARALDHVIAFFPPSLLPGRLAGLRARTAKAIVFPG